MIDALLDGASARCVFVAGKGGAGKTTTAGAFALALADAASTTHLISTDPAHSLGDLFEQDLAAGAATVSSCHPGLVLEEFSARAYADTLFDELRAPLIELMERGTYLDAEDAAGFLDLSLPGIDEAMATLRIVDLYDSAVERIVVDTAPTGHTIRLLDAAATIESWVAAAHAMADKARVVAAHLVGTRIVLAAEPLLDELQRKATRFQNDVLRESRAIVVTRAGDVVRRETERLHAALDERGVAIGAVIAVGGGSEAAFTVELIPTPVGCAGLREWVRQVRPGGGAPAAGARPAPSAATPDAQVWLRSLSAKLVFVAGKGGVGKSTCAAAIAASLAQERRVCLVGSDPAGSLSDVLGTAVSANPIEIEPGFFARQIDAASEFQRARDQYRTSVLEVFESLGLDTAAQLDRQVVERLWDFAPPGIDEIIAMVEIIESAGSYDTLVIDSAPTGHFLRLIELPDIALDWVHALLRMLMKYGAVASLDALARDLLAFAKRIRQLKLDLSTPDTTAAFVVTLDEAMVSAETARLSSALARAGVPVAATILNKSGGPTVSENGVQRIRAPDLHEEVIGPPALRSFLAQWSISV